jgi:hypothetical protein
MRRLSRHYIVSSIADPYGARFDQEDSLPEKMRWRLNGSTIHRKDGYNFSTQQVHLFSTGDLNASENSSSLAHGLSSRIASASCRGQT